MNYINQIAYNLDRRDEVPNQELARKLADSNNKEGLREIASHLYDKNKSIASDCIKVIYETGYIKPELIAPYTDEFAKLLSSKQNRMVWGAMIALSCAANADADKVFKYKDLILEKIETGTVITHVAGVKTLINLAKNRKYYDELKPILFKLQIECRPIDFAKRAEDMMHVIPANDISGYVDILKSGKQNLSAAGAKRTERVIKKLTLKSNS